MPINIDDTAERGDAAVGAGAAASRGVPSVPEKVHDIQCRNAIGEPNSEPTPPGPTNPSPPTMRKIPAAETRPAGNDPTSVSSPTLLPERTFFEMSEDLSNPTDTIGGADESVSRAADQDVRPSAICDVLKDAEAQAASMELPASGVAGHVRFLDLFDSNRPPGNLAQAVNALTRRIQRLEKRGHSVALAFDSSTGLFRLVVAEPEKTAKS